MFPLPPVILLSPKRKNSSECAYYPSVCLCLTLPFYLSVCLSVCLSVSLSLSLSLPLHFSLSLSLYPPSHFLSYHLLFQLIPYFYLFLFFFICQAFCFPIFHITFHHRPISPLSYDSTSDSVPQYLAQHSLSHTTPMFLLILLYPYKVIHQTLAGKTTKMLTLFAVDKSWLQTASLYNTIYAYCSFQSLFVSYHFIPLFDLGAFIHNTLYASSAL